MKVLKQLATSAAILAGQEPDIALQHILQGAAMCVRRANARASLRRAADAPVEVEVQMQMRSALSVLQAMDE